MPKAIILKNLNGFSLRNALSNCIGYSRVLLVLLVLLAACGDRAVKRGIIYDSAVSNLNYQTDSFSGLTDDAGEFQYRPHEAVTFSLGAIQLGTRKGDNVITLLQLTDSDSVTDVVVTNMARLLQSLDDDLDSSNGIQIPALAHSSAVSDLDFSLSPEAFADDARVQALMLAVKGNSDLSVSAEDAQAHLQATLVSLGFNQAPSVTVSADQSVTSGDQVVLSATVADADGTIAAINWLQILADGDIDVTLLAATDNNDATNDLSGLSVTFIAPIVEISTILVFEFTATDDQGTKSSLQTRVTIDPKI